MRSALDAWLFASGWVATAAAALLAAASAGLQVPLRPAALGLAFFGTLVIYNVDRVRDRERDRATAPERTRFVERHRRTLRAVTVAAAAGAGMLAWLCGPTVIALVGAVALVGLFHRRLKRHATWKALYLTTAWVLVTVGVPAVLGPAPRHVGFVAAILGLALLANALASNVRDGEGPSPAAPTLALARSVAAAGVVTASLGPEGPRALGCVPLATLGALLSFRPSERYGLGVVDGALVAGSALTLALYGLG